LRKVAAGLQTRRRLIKLRSDCIDPASFVFAIVAGMATLCSFVSAVGAVWSRVAPREPRSNDRPPAAVTAIGFLLANATDWAV
jgi:hypothetical protein